MTTRHDLSIRQGETFSFTWTKRDSAGAAVDLSGFTARMAIRDRVGGSLEAYLSTGSDADGGTITLGGAAGTVTVAMTATESGDLAGGLSSVAAAIWGEPVLTVERVVEFVYDLELVNGVTVTRELEGRIELHRQVST